MTDATGSPGGGGDLPVTWVRPRRGGFSLELREMWVYRDLLYFLTWRDIKVRYTQAALGVAWAVIQPVISMVIFSVIFGRLAGLPSGGVPYPVYAYTALLPWGLFAGALARAGSSLVADAPLLTKVYFPRLIIPLSAVTAGLVDFGAAFPLLLGMMAWYGLPLTWNALWLPLLVLFALLTAFAVGLWLAALNVQYRDVQYAIPFLIQAWLYASPVAYSADLVPEGIWTWIYGLNPMAGVIQGFRWALLGTPPPQGLMAASALMVLLLLAGGLWYFRRMEDSFADVV